MSLSKKVANTIGYGNALKIKYFFQKPKPKEIIIDICAACNAACPFCPRLYMPEERSKGYMELELFKFILTEAKKEGIKNIRLYSTAEPTLHPKFNEIINYLVEGDFFISISTNASLLDKHIESLMKVNILQYSVEGWDKESYERYRIPLKFDKIYNNIKLFHKEKLKRTQYPQISTNLLLTKHTNLKKYMELWAEYIDKIKIHFMAEATIFEEGKFVSKKNKEILNEYYDFTKQKENFICTYPFTVLTIAFDGKIALCCNDFSASLDIANVKEGIKNVYKSSVIKEIREEFYTQKLNKCKDCSFFSVALESDIGNIKKEIFELEIEYKNKIEKSF